MRSRVVTFYSYKGGVGRSFALANVATILAQWGARVLVVDWDIEAPGLDHYFAGHRGVANAGVLDFLDDCMSGSVGDWSKYCQRIDAPGLQGRLDLMPARADRDANDRDYTSLVQSLNWDALYDRFNLGAQLETMRAAWLENFDFVLLDSRTGLTDFSGITTAQLPDILLFMFTANQQSLGGCVEIARRALDARREMPVDRPAILPLPVPARIEQRDEYDQAQLWRGRFVTQLSKFLDTWAPKHIDRLKLLDQITIPYVPRWTFGEEVAALSELGGKSGVRSPSEAASFACETIAAVLALGLEKTDLLTSSRDEYIHNARSSFRPDEERDQPVRMFVSFRRGSSTRLLVQELVRQLEEATQRDVELVNMAAPGGGTVGGTVEDLVESADLYAVIFDQADGSGSGYQAAEVEWMIRQNLRDTRPRPLVPLVLPGGESEFYSSRLADYQAILIEPDEQLGQSLAPVVRRLAKQLLRGNGVLSARGEDFLDRTSPDQPMTLGAWSRSSSGWSGSGPTKFLLSSREYSRAFRVSTQLQFEGAGDADIDTAIVFGWSQPAPSQRTYWAVRIGLDSVSLEHHLPGQAENTTSSAELSGPLKRSLRARKPHRFVMNVDQTAIVLTFEGEELFRAASPASTTGRVGLRVRNMTTTCTAFEIEVL